MDNIFSLEGKVVVLTGGYGNLGRSMSKALLDFGANLIVFDCVEKVPESLERTVPIRCDLSNTESVREAFREVYNHFGRLDALVNNAAYGGGAGGVKVPYKVEEITDDNWNLGLDGTLGVTFRCSREAVLYLEKQFKLR